MTDRSLAIDSRFFHLSSPLVGPGLARSEFKVYEAKPRNPSRIRGGLIVIQEIFGVNSHIRAVADGYASEGYVAWAPSYFDHVETDIELTYEPRSFVKGRDLAQNLGWDQAVEDTLVAVKALEMTLPQGQKKIGVVGFCWGGSLAWLSACRSPSRHLAAAVSYYGRATHEFRNEKPHAPAMLHFGRNDASIPMENVDDFKQAQPGVPVFVYEAGHGFNCDQRKDFNEYAASEARRRTLEFFRSKGL